MGSVTVSSNDGWRGEWIRIFMNGNETHYLKCSIYNWVDGDSHDPKIKSSLHFDCFKNIPEGSRIFQSTTKYYVVLQSKLLIRRTKENMDYMCECNYILLSLSHTT